MQGIGASSAQQAVGQHHGQQTTNLPAANSSVMASEVSDLCGTEPTGMTESEIQAAMARAERAVERCYSLAVCYVTSNQWQEAKQYADRGYAHLQQLIALARMHQRSNP